MNDVSWLIYFSNVAANMGGLLIFLGCCVAVIAGVYFGLAFVQGENASSYSHDNESNLKYLAQAKKTRRFVPTLIILAFVLWILAAMVPSQNTVLAIAASQVGEKVLKSESGNLAIQALNAWLQRQITTPQPSKPE